MGHELARIFVHCHDSIPNSLLFVRREAEDEREVFFCYIDGDLSDLREDMWDDYKRNARQIAKEA
jgi:hypothetical protein